LYPQQLVVFSPKSALVNRCVSMEWISGVSETTSSPETLEIHSMLTWLIAWEDLIELSLHAASNVTLFSLLKHLSRNKICLVTLYPTDTLPPQKGCPLYVEYEAGYALELVQECFQREKVA
jgi:hypothetical protein